MPEQVRSDADKSEKTGSLEIRAHGLQIVISAVANQSEGLVAGPAPNPCEAPMPGPNPEWQWLSPTEQQIVALVSEDTPMTAKSLAVGLGLIANGGEAVPSRLYILLQNLVERKILNSSGEGYTLRAAPKRADEADPLGTP